MNTEERPTILVVDDDEFALENVCMSIEQSGASAVPAASAQQALNRLREHRFQVIVTDVKMPGMDGITFVERVKEDHPHMKFIVVTGYADESAVIRALRLGVNEFLKKPYRNVELLLAIDKLLKQIDLENENRSLRDRLVRENIELRAEVEACGGVHAPYDLLGDHPSIEAVRELAAKIGRFGVNALIRGENGTGKELVAQAIRRASPRAQGVYHAVNCAAISTTLFEAEMFGYEKGAFTGAVRSRPGLFESASGGILFLDEITEVPTGMQAKLLRALETGTIRRVGGTVDIPIDVHVIAATNRIPSEAIADGYLRRDVYHRLATMEVVIPPLRDRSSDIPMLARHFHGTFARQFSVNADPISDAAMDALVRAPWPGNVRQLANVMKRWVLFDPSTALSDLSTDTVASVAESILPGSMIRYDFIRGTMDEVEEAKHLLVRTVLSRNNGNKSSTARQLGLSYPGLLKMLRRINDGDGSESSAS
jgi:DNA-binding NtrC family response regulator